MKKRLILFAFCIIVIISMLFITALAEENFDKKASAMYAAGILTQEQAELNSNVQLKRGDALEIAVKIFANVIVSAKQVYNDVGASSDYFLPAYISNSQGVDIGIDGDLKPTESIITEDFAKILMAMSEYDFMAVKYSNYENPYTIIAKQLKILPQTYSGREYVTYGQAVDMIYELLMTDAPNILYGEKNNKYSVPSGITILERFMNIKCAEGTVSATEFSSANSYISSLNVNQIELSSYDGYKMVFSNAGSFSNLLGYNAIVWYKKDGNINKAIYAFPSGNDEICIDGSNFVNIDINERKVYYSEVTQEDRFETKSKEKSKKLPYDAEIIYNGQYTTNANTVFNILSNPGELNIDKIVLLDNDSNGIIDFVLIDVYKNFGVASVNSAYNTVTSTRNEVLEYDEDDKFYNIMLDGKRVDFDSIGANVLLSIKEGLGTKPLLNIEIVDNAFLGSFHRIVADTQKAYAEISVGESTDRGNNFVGSFVGGTDNQLHIVRYDLDNFMFMHHNEIVIGDNHLYRIFVDKKGKIGALGVYTYGSGNYSSWYMEDFVTSTYSTIEFGIGIRIRKESKKTYELKVATIKKVLRSVTVETYKTSKDLKIKNIPDSIVNTYGSDWSKYSDNVLDELFLNNLFEISFDEDGLINRITFPYEIQTEGRLSYFNAPGQKYMYNAGILRSLTTNDFLFANNKQMCIQIPKAGTQPGFDSLYRLVNFTANTFVTNGVYELNAYTFSKSNAMPDFVVMINDYDMVETNNRVNAICIGVVQKSTKVASDFGDIDSFIVGGMSNVAPYGSIGRVVSVYDNTYITPTSADDTQTVGGMSVYYKANLNGLSTYADPIDKGDIVIFTMPHQNVAYSAIKFYTSAFKLYDYGTKTIVHNTNGAAVSPKDVVVGKIKKVDNQFISMAVDDRGTNDEDLIDIMYAIESNPTDKQIRMYTFEYARKNKAPVLKQATRADLEEAMNENLTVAVAARRLIVIYKD